MSVEYDRIGRDERTLHQNQRGEECREQLIDAAPRCRHAPALCENDTDDGMQHEPEQERSLLPCPERREFIEQRQVDRRVGDNVAVAEIIRKNNCKEKYRCAERCAPCKAGTYPAAARIPLHIREHSAERKDEDCA